ncbi:hypothetical protein COW36_16355 [bacterium (Candidatus Blackallbacteria) CG17_big_fil_post_rev_8_21_14_2_50_48_46]|uniref:DNA-binding response regulator n=1 Tax=bacterium (Candidatus Blackallbacteria) CG17_big_fil_post_rev_8_21_14_2_50_48_46 TaxID=2014261 RepID=A0A2M7G259_9BACT|nr:MAG: hypothetical protein COW64_08380 [bacterium (Candidatus Blackallbacteria) CG18_big_fil_WC_8_21_14_2_50_49_26]PIW15661.1 MAG: hypothetical protein COW36_16355 [bacterium (Candidatus Blackallbacteria) CG17_big_fil_post_rev_8_21_14_2_50_48_46]PIW47304.1 MAG: hypothetical protein COW20_13095 [bacterium (Candidatus Blackallbacteria) CG13_big_fil_rev_8_21_14_2_50_49_14]
MPNNSLKILLVDDHPLTLMGIRLMLEDKELPFAALEIYEASGAQEAFTLAQKNPPKLAIIDMNLQDGHGLELSHQLLELIPDLKILFYTGSASNLPKADLIKAGAHGFLSKNMEPEKLIQAVICVSMGGYYFDDQRPDQVFAEKQPEKAHLLSKREMEVLRMLAEDYNKDNIAFNLGISVRTVETYRARLMKKLGIRSVVGLARYALEQGIVELPPQ